MPNEYDAHKHDALITVTTFLFMLSLFSSMLYLTLGLDPREQTPWWVFGWAGSPLGIALTWCGGRLVWRYLTGKR